MKKSPKKGPARACLLLCTLFLALPLGGCGKEKASESKEDSSLVMVEDSEVVIGARNMLDTVDKEKEAKTDQTEEGNGSQTSETSLLSGEALTASELAEDEGDETDAASTIDRSTLPDIDLTEWQYILVNADNPCGEYAPTVSKLEGIELDSRIIDAMTDFVEAARAEGLPVYLSSGYRDYDTQTYLYKRKISQGYSEAEAATIVAPPGTSEHQTGLASDITDVYRKTKNESLEDTETYKWMSAHCQEYGFIVRFPKGKEDYTGIIYEPWHYRHVGVEAATYIMEHDLCLEEFVALYQ